MSDFLNLALTGQTIAVGVAASTMFTYSMKTFVGCTAGDRLLRGTIDKENAGAAMMLASQLNGLSYSHYRRAAGALVAAMVFISLQGFEDPQVLDDWMHSPLVVVLALLNLLHMTVILMCLGMAFLPIDMLGVSRNTANRFKNARTRGVAVFKGTRYEGFDGKTLPVVACPGYMSHLLSERLRMEAQAGRI